MPSELTHIQQANRNQAAINHLAGSGEIVYPEWVATIAFYKALHVVEAVFSQDKIIEHRQTHKARLETLKKTGKYQHIFRHYDPLWRASLIARYLVARSGKQYRSFAIYLSADHVISEMLAHRLHQVQKSAMRFLTAEAKAMLTEAVPPAGEGI